MSETGITVKDLPIKNSALIEDVILIVNQDGVNFQISIEDLFKDIQIPTLFTLGLEKVDNTSDLEKPLSRATVEALNKKAAVLHEHELSSVVGLVDALNTIYQRLEMFEDAADYETIKANLTLAVNELLEELDLNNHTHDASQIVNLEEFIQEKFSNEVITQVNNIIEPITDRMSQIEATLASIQEAIAGLSQANHKHEIDDINGLRYYVDRVTLSPLDPDDNIIGNDGWR